MECRSGCGHPVPQEIHIVNVDYPPCGWCEKESEKIDAAIHTERRRCIGIVSSVFAEFEMGMIESEIVGKLLERIGE